MSKTLFRYVIRTNKGEYIPQSKNVRGYKIENAKLYPTKEGAVNYLKGLRSMWVPGSDIQKRFNRYKVIEVNITYKFGEVILDAVD